MKKSPQIIGIVLANLFLVSFILMAPLAIWWKSMYAVGMGVAVWRVVSILAITVLALTVALTWITVRMLKSKR